VRLNPYVVRPDVYDSIRSVSRELARGRLERPLRHLVELRVSQLNRCGFCLAMHSEWARAAGVPQAKLDSLAEWHDDNAFTPRERSALELAEAMTALGDAGADDDVWGRAASEFNPEELADLLFLIGLMNLYTASTLLPRYLPSSGASKDSKD
jgi:AhpD family alkylhydroperoxidase